MRLIADDERGSLGEIEGGVVLLRRGISQHHLVHFGAPAS